MERRTRKPPVKPEVRREWLRRYEEDGESPPGIAKSNGFDVRTVRRQIELAREEREVREARSHVLRNALESHYADLCRLAEKLKSEIGKEGALSPLLRDEPMWSALRQHLPRSPLWKYLVKRDQLQEELADLLAVVKALLKETAESDPRLKTLSSPEREAVINFVIEATAYQMADRSRGREGLDIESHFRVETTAEGLVSIHYGRFQADNVQHQHVELVKDVLTDYEVKVTSLQQYEEMRRLFSALERLKRQLTDELDIIIYRRIVPGRCKYCPM